MQNPSSNLTPQTNADNHQTQTTLAAPVAVDDDAYHPPTSPVQQPPTKRHRPDTQNPAAIAEASSTITTPQATQISTTNSIRHTSPTLSTISIATSTTSTTSSHQPAVASHYNAIQQRTLADRKHSTIIGLRNYNNWVKSVLIKHYGLSHLPAGQPAVVLDLCSGKGGDLKKFSKSRIGYYVAADHAYKSMCDAIERYNTPYPLFPAQFICADCHRALLSSVLPSDLAFDLVSVQFALHYSFETEQTARTFMRNIAERLMPGGRVLITLPDANVLVHRLREQPADVYSFGNSCFNVEFNAESIGTNKTFPPNRTFGLEYTFDLSDAIDHCPEYLVHNDSLLSLASEVQLELVYESGLHQFWYDHYNISAEYRELAQRMNVVSGGNTRRHDGSTVTAGISVDEWEAIGLYKCVVLRKKLNAKSPLNDGVVRRQHFPDNRQLSRLTPADICVCTASTATDGGTAVCQSTHDVKLTTQKMQPQQQQQHQRAR